jgi:hypothetical protein
MGGWVLCVYPLCKVVWLLGRAQEQQLTACLPACMPAASSALCAAALHPCHATLLFYGQLTTKTVDGKSCFSSVTHPSSL